ncbi:hypothetical protein MRX96_014638 [Rhipicephalus microplus]
MRKNFKVLPAIEGTRHFIERLLSPFGFRCCITWTLLQKCVPEPVSVSASFPLSEPLKVGLLRLEQKRNEASQEPNTVGDDASKEEGSSNALGQLGLLPDSHLFRSR